jgi:flavin-dependent dehydrogenase
VEYRERGNLKEERARIIIGADGMNSMVRKEVFGTRPYRVISAYQVDSAARLEDQDSVQVFVGSDVTRGFFGWATPSDNLTRIGVGTHGGASFRYFKSLNSRFGESKILGINGGGIPISYLRKTYSRRAMLVGDAAGIVKPLSGGGIYTGMVSGKHAAATAVDALEREDFSESAMSAYQRLWKKDLGNELWFDGMFQRLFSMISDRSFNRIYSILSSPEVIEKINERGDIDYPSRVVISLLARRPWLLRHIIQGKS